MVQHIAPASFLKTCCSCDTVNAFLNQVGFGTQCNLRVLLLILRDLSLDD